VLQQRRLGATPVATTHLFEATRKVVVEVALSRPQRDTGKVGDLLVRQTVALQPQCFPLALDVRVQVFVTILRNRFQVDLGHVVPLLVRFLVPISTPPT
jgi:hypothetical protein